jgi:uncharacterized metal-binding protein
MPGAHTHDKITLVSGIGLAPIWWVLSPDHSLATVLTITSAHLISGLIFSCDLDIDSIEYRRWGILRVIWWPYKEAVPHRSWLSHGLIIGPLLRLAYFGLIVYGLLWLFFTVTNNPELWQALQQSFVQTIHEYSGQTYAFLLGFVSGGAAHSIPDWLTTGTKRAWNQWTRF